MQPKQRDILRKQLLKQIQSDPESVVDLIISLMVRIEKLEDQLNKNSNISSKPPSSDKGLGNRSKNRSLRGKSGKKSGGQPGHTGHTLQRVDHPDKTVEHRLQHCPKTGRTLTDADIIDTIRCQVFDIPEPKMEVTEHIYYVYATVDQKQTITAHAPFIQGASAPVQYGKHFGSLLVYLSDYQLLPMARISQLCADLYGQKISQDTINRFRNPCYDNLDTFEQAVKQQLLTSPVLHADETGIRIEKKTEWLHVLSNSTHTYLHASDHRGGVALEEMDILAQYRGTLVHDCYSSYFKLGCEHALCNAHLLRELTFFIEVKNHTWARKMKQMLCAALQDPQSHSPEAWKRRYKRILTEAHKECPYQPPNRKKGKRGREAKPAVNNLIDRFQTHQKAILRFLTEQSVPFTNNQGEQDLRMAKVQQKISGTFRTWSGARKFARIRSYLSTAQKQGISAFKAIRRAIDAQPMFCET